MEIGKENGQKILINGIYISKNSSWKILLIIIMLILIVIEIVKIVVILAMIIII